MTTKPISYAFKIKVLRWMTGNSFARGCNIIVEQQGAWAEDTPIGGTMNQTWNSIHEVSEVYLWVKAILMKQMLHFVRCWLVLY